MLKLLSPVLLALSAFVLSAPVAVAQTPLPKSAPNATTDPALAPGASVDGEQESATERAQQLRTTAGRVYQEARGQLKRMQQLLQRQQELLNEAQETELSLAIETIEKDLQAMRDLYEFGQDRLRSLKRDLAVDDNSKREIEDPLAYPEIRQLGVVRDQLEQLFLGSKKFLASLQEAPETTVTRLNDENDEDGEDN